MAKKNIKIKKNEEAPESTELLASSIVEIANFAERIKNGRLSSRAIVVLLHDGIGATKISKGQIKLVLDNLPRLKAWYIR